MVSERTSRLTLAAALVAFTLILLFPLRLIDEVVARPEDPPYQFAFIIMGLLLAVQVATGASKEAQTWGFWTYLALAWGSILPGLVVHARESSSARWLVAAAGLLLVIPLLRFLLPPEMRARIYGTPPKPPAGTEPG